MKLEKIIADLEKEYPSVLACGWDNPGLQVGRRDAAIKKVMVALDATDDVIAQCMKEEAQLLVTHHPLLMSGIRNVTLDTLTGGKALTLAEHQIAHYAIHTNYDVVRMTELAKKAMKLKDTKVLEATGIYEDGAVYGIGCVGISSKKMTARDLSESVKKAFDLDRVRLFGDPDVQVGRIALSPGSGKSMIDSALAAGADVLVTGDIGHHEGIDAVDQGLLIIDAGHYGMEHVFIKDMVSWLEKHFQKLTVKAAHQKQPFLFL